MTDLSREELRRRLIQPHEACDSDGCPECDGRGYMFGDDTQVAVLAAIWDLFPGDFDADEPDPAGIALAAVAAIRALEADPVGLAEYQAEAREWAELDVAVRDE